jgi:hypothetical protein
VPLQTPHRDAVRGRTARVPVRRRIEGEIEIAPPVEIVFETTRSRTPTRFFFSRVLQPFVVNLLGTTVYQDIDEWRNCSATPTFSGASSRVRQSTLEPRG